VQNFAFKFQAVAEKTAKIGGYFILPHPVRYEFFRRGKGPKMRTTHSCKPKWRCNTCVIAAEI